MVTLAEKQAARRAAVKKRLKSAGKTRATSLSGTVERTAQRRGRAFDQLTLVTAPPPPPQRAARPPPPPPPKTICDVLGSGNPQFGRRGTTVPRGVSFACGGQAIQFNAQSNNTTRNTFGTTIRQNQNRIRAAGLGHLIPKSEAEKQNARNQIKGIRSKQSGCQKISNSTSRRNCLIDLGSQIDAIEKEFGF